MHRSLSRRPRGSGLLNKAQPNRFCLRDAYPPAVRLLWSESGDELEDCVRFPPLLRLIRESCRIFIGHKSTVVVFLQTEKKSLFSSGICHIIKSKRKWTSRIFASTHKCSNHLGHI